MNAKGSIVIVAGDGGAEVRISGEPEPVILAAGEAFQLEVATTVTAALATSQNSPEGER